MGQTLTLNKVHDVRRDPQSGARRLMGENHYISFRRGDGPTVFVQNGRAFHEGGPEFADHELPDWLPEEAAKVSASKAERIGLDRLLERLNGDDGVSVDTTGQETPQEANGHEAPVDGTPETDDKGIFTDAEGNRRYWCPTCRVSMEPRKKGGHMMSVHGAGKR